MVGFRGKAVVTSWLMVAMAAGVSAAPPEPGFWLMGYPPGGTNGAVHALSQDGLVAGGSNYGMPEALNAAFRWTAKAGREDWGLLPGMPFNTTVSGIDATGQAFVGFMQSASQPNPRPYRRIGDGPLQDLGTLPGESRSFAHGVSGDGNVVVGHAEHGAQTNAFGQAFRWTPTKGMQGLGYAKSNGTYSVASGISRDGSTIVGKSQSFGPFGPVDAFVWTEAGGMKALPGLPNAPYISTNARGVSADGSVAVGEAPHVDGVTHAVRWVNGGIQDLTVGSGFTSSLAFAVNDDGSVVGGVAGSHAFVWTPATKMMLASDFLALYGVTVPSDYTLEEVHAISGDGLTFGGYARNLATNQTEGFVATVPTPSLAAVFAVPLVAMACRRRRG